MDAIQSSALSTKDLILQSAGGLFLSQGYLESGVAAILKLSGVQAPTLYYHFGDKEGLYMTWVESALQELGQRIREALVNPVSDETALAAIVRALADSEHPDVFQLRRDAKLLLRSDNRERLHRNVFEAVYEPVMGLLLKASERGQVEARFIDRMTQSFIGGALGLRSAYALQTSDIGGAPEWWAAHFLRAMRT